MSVVQISEYPGRDRDPAGQIIDALTSAMASQKVTIGTVASSNAVGSKLIRIAAQADCCIAIGTSPVASNLASANPSDYFPAGCVEVRFVNIGDKVSVIAA